MDVRYSAAFKRQLKRLASRYKQIKSDVQPIIDALIAGETPGDQIAGTTYTLYKVRAKNSDSQRGKSGGYRIIYYLKTDTHCTLVTIYSKSDQGDISTEKLERLMRDII
jgi:mRNA-degrading endonuclease RelE of RelBE toxin-antitoxin system